MERKYLFAFIYDYKDCLFRDIVALDSPLEYLPSHKIYKNKVASFIESCALSYQVNSKVKVPFQQVFYNLESYRYEKGIPSVRQSSSMFFGFSDNSSRTSTFQSFSSSLSGHFFDKSRSSDIFMLPATISWKAPLIT